MNLYLDDDSVDSVLIRLLRQAGHDVQVPSDVGLSGADDAIHFRYAVRDDRIVLSHNFRDFENLHHLVLDAGGHHPGILMVRKDNDPRKDMTPRGVVNAFTRLLSAGVPIANEFNVLNHWR